MAAALWIICPCFFDAALVPRLKSEIEEAFSGDRRIGKIRFIIIDDSSGQDAFVQKELAGLEDAEIFSMPFNGGHQAAIVYGLRSLSPRISDEDCVLTMDCDGEDRPQDAPKLIEPILEDKENLHRVVLARRTRRRESFAFKCFYSAFKVVFRIMTGTVITNGNFAAFRGRFVKEVIFHPHFDQAYASAFISLPLQLKMVPLPRGERYAGTSKMGYMGLISHGIRMFMPFSEKIAVRGLAASVLLAFFSLLGLFLVALDRNHALFPSIPQHLKVYSLLFCTAMALNSSGIFALLFTTFSQSKSRTWRGLHDFQPGRGT